MIDSTDMHPTPPSLMITKTTHNKTSFTTMTNLVHRGFYFSDTAFSHCTQ